MNDTAVAPRIRFKGFDSDWEERSFSELYRLNVRKNDLTYGNEDIISVAKMFYSPDPTITNEDYLKTYNIMEVGDIAFEGNKSKSFAYGRFVENDIGNGIVSHVFQVFSPMIDMDVAFWRYMINDEHVMRPILADSTKTSTMMREIVPSRFLKQRIYIPCLDEQKKVGQLLSLVDRLINLYERVVPIFDLLVESRFIEMFGTLDNPKYGTIQISELVSKTIEKVAKTYDSEDLIHYIDISSIIKDSKSVENMTEYVVKKAPSRAQQCVKKGDILLSNVRPNLKTIAMIDSDKDNLVCSSGFSVLRCEKCEPEYLVTAITDDVFTDLLMKKATGSSYPAVTTKDVLEQEIPYGPEDIQKNFATLVKQVDKSKFNYIKKYEALKKLRESLICEMLIPVSNNEENKVRL